MPGSTRGMGLARGSQVSKRLDFAALDAASWSDTTYTVNGVSVVAINSARMDAFGPDGSSGLVLDSKAGTTHEADSRDTGRIHIGLGNVFNPGAWYLSRPMFVVASFAAALVPAGNTNRTLELGVDTGTGVGAGISICASRLAGSAGGSVVSGWRSLTGADLASSTINIEPTWLGMLIEPLNVQAFAGTGTPPSEPRLADHVSPAAGFTVTSLQNPGIYTPEAAATSTRTIYVAAAGHWSTAPILRSITCYTLAPI
jgi:hypothetical protein